MKACNFFLNLDLLDQKKKKTSVVVSGGKIARVHPLSRSSASSNLAAAAALATGRKINASSLVLFKRDTIVGPGLVDSHVHANEPGRERWEGLATASAAAAAGGVTTVVDMPLNSAPAATSARLLREKAEAVEAVRRRGEREGDSDDGDDGDDEAAAAAAAAPLPQKRGGLSCDVGLWAGLVPSNARDPRELNRMFSSSSSRGVLGFKAFLSPSGIGDFERTSVREAEAAMAVLAELGAPLLLHAELLPEHRENFDNGDRESKEEEGKEAAAAAEVVKVTDLESWAASRPEEMEVAAITEVVAALARVVEKRKNTSPSSPSSFRVHIAHVAAPSALPVIARAKARGLPLSAETCPHYLGLLDPRSPPRRREERGERKEGDSNESAAAAGVAVAASLLKCAPPLRADVSSVASKKLWAALEDGTLDSVASDHSPTTPGMKRRGKEEGEEEEEKKKTGGADSADDSRGAEEEGSSFSRAWGGISGLQFLLPSTWSSAPTRPATVEEEDALAEKLHRWLSSAPAALAGLSGRKGAISAGLDADFVAWKPRELADVSFAACRLRHCENSPFVGTGADLGMRGRVVATFLRGQLVFSEREEEEREEEEGEMGRDSLPRALLTGCGGRLLER